MTSTDELTAEQREALSLLAAHLAALPEGCEYFDMDIYAMSRDGDVLGPDRVEPGCGTVCCAAGHGPLAGVPALPEEGWSEYCGRAFGLDSGKVAWIWCFSAIWSAIDPTPAAAAARIRRYLLSGVPSFEDPAWRGDQR